MFKNINSLLTGPKMKKNVNYKTKNVFFQFKIHFKPIQFQGIYPKFP